MRRLLVTLTLLGTTLASVPAAATAAPADRASSLAAYRAVQADIAVPTGWTGSVSGCVVGDESADSRAATLRTINTLRSYAGVGGVTLSDEYNRKALAAALMMRANKSLSHSPGPGWPCSSADGQAGAGSSNLFLGTAGADAMVGYVDDSGVASLGHRRWVLDPSATTFGTGSTGPTDASGPTTNALWVFGPSTPVAAGTLVAWPPGGYVPWDWVFGDWSVAVGNDGQTVDVSAATVAVSMDGTPLTVSGTRDMGSGYGSGGTLAWKVAVPEASRRTDHALDVTVTGVTVDGAPQPIAYRINAFTATPVPTPTPTPTPTPIPTPTTTPGPGGGGLGENDGTPARPAFTRRPRITGTARVGRLLRSSVAVRGLTRLSYRWRRNGSPIKGATRSSYRVTRRDRGRRLSVRVTGRTSAGRTVVATSATVRVRK